MPAGPHKLAHYKRATAAKLLSWVHRVLTVGSVLEICCSFEDHARVYLMTSLRDSVIW